MSAVQVFEAAVIDGRKYVSTERRGVEYTLQRLGDGWFVSSRRLALGRSNMGGGKHYATLEAVKTGCAAFAACDLLEVL